MRPNEGDGARARGGYGKLGPAIVRPLPRRMDDDDGMAALAAVSYMGERRRAGEVENAMVRLLLSLSPPCLKHKLNGPWFRGYISAPYPVLRCARRRPGEITRRLRSIPGGVPVSISPEGATRILC